MKPRTRNHILRALKSGDRITATYVTLLDPSKHWYQVTYDIEERDGLLWAVNGSRLTGYRGEITRRTRELDSKLSSLRLEHFELAEQKA